MATAASTQTHGDSSTYVVNHGTQTNLEAQISSGDELQRELQQRLDASKANNRAAGAAQARCPPQNSSEPRVSPASTPTSLRSQAPAPPELIAQLGAQLAALQATVEQLQAGQREQMALLLDRGAQGEEAHAGGGGTRAAEEAHGAGAPCP